VSRVPRPAGLSGAGIVLAGVAFALYAVARTTGAGWDIVILCALVAALVVGAIWPAVALVGVGVRVTTPLDGMVGAPLPVDVALRGHASGLRVRVLSAPSGWYRADAPGTGRATVVPPRRGVVSRVVVELRSTSPLGLVAWRRRIPVPLGHDLEVAPQPLTARDDTTRGANRDAQARPQAPSSGHDETRGVRDYVSGDPIRLVHWPATARTGAVMVRELEGMQRARLLIVVDLRTSAAGGDAEVEIAASRAAGLAIAALDRGTLVDLATVEPAGPRRAPVRSALEVGRRLARAVPGPPGPVTVPAGVEVRHVRSGTTA
jgi:uncharacterized protein (DUF58 family)